MPILKAWFFGRVLCLSSILIRAARSKNENEKGSKQDLCILQAETWDNATYKTLEKDISQHILGLTSNFKHISGFKGYVINKLLYLKPY